MPSEALFLGMHVDAHGVGLILLDKSGQEQGALQRAYTGCDEAVCDPQDWWRAVRTGVKELLRRTRRQASQIRAVGVSGPADIAVLLDKEQQVLTPASFVCDDHQRAALDELHHLAGVRNLANLCGSTGHPGSMAARMLVIREQERRAWHDLVHVLGAKDFLVMRLTGKATTDPASASRSNLFNPRIGRWSKQLLDRLHYDAAWLPEVLPGNQICGRVSAVAAQETGLQSGTVVVTGADALTAAAIACAAIDPGDTVITLGDEGSMMQVTAAPVRDPQHHVQTSGHCLAQVMTLRADAVAPETSVNWLADAVFSGMRQQARRARRSVIDLLAESAAEAPPASDGVLFIVPDGTHPGAFVGLRPEHRQAHMVRAVFEQAALAAARMMARFEALTQVPQRRVLVHGSGAATTLWCQILSDALDHELQAYTASHLSARGAAMLAASAVGLYKTIPKACKAMSCSGQVFKPRRAAVAAYEAMTPDPQTASALLAELDGQQ